VPHQDRVKVFADGGSRGNPGPSASGFVILDMDDTVLVEDSLYLGITTNNQAEYTALKIALEKCKELGVHEVFVHMDSLLVVNQMKGIFKIRNRELWPIHQAIKDLMKSFKHVDFVHVPRELNKLADAAVNRAMDKELGITHPKSQLPNL
jgi:ribonuclease HI